MIIVDSHAHLGVSAVSELRISANDLLNAMDRHSIDASIVLPHPVTANYRKAHDDIAELATLHPGRIFGVASLSPQVGSDIYEMEVYRCVRELDFVAIKYHPVLHNALPTSKITRSIFDLAKSLDIPVIVHTGLGLPWAHPAQLTPLACDYPDVKIVFAHSGFLHYALEALNAAQMHANIYLETSWSGPDSIKHFVETVGARRVMMGADGLLNIPVELKKYEVINLPEQDLALCLGGTAIEVFKLNIA